MKPIAWVRLYEDGSVKSEFLLESSPAMSDSRRTCGRWLPLYSHDVASHDLPELPEPTEITHPELNQSALGCGVEDRGITDRYEAAEYGFLDALRKVAEWLPEELYTAEQMREYALKAIRGES